MNRLEELKNVELGEKIGYKKGFEDARKQFERPHGEWVFDSSFTEFGNPYGTYKCSVCGTHSSNKYSFCKDCGAEMIQKTCGNCYWFSKVTVPCCEQDCEPTKETEKACDRWEEGETE